jgi:hypothetical protein
METITKPKAFGPQHDVPTSVCPTLCTILSWPRCYKTDHEIAFNSWLVAEIKKRTKAQVLLIADGCIFVQIEKKKGVQPSALFSCHTDTVDYAVVQPEGSVAVPRKKLTYDPNFGIIGLDPANTVGSCLGADDGAGIWVMLNMIEKGVNGGYIFHRGEEKGGQGAYAMLSTQRPLLEKFDMAVAFDRPNDSEIITHQGGMECASQKFAKSLQDEFTKHGLDMAASSRGVFTDTKVYRGVIAECINLGVGYTNQHGREETQDYAHLVALTRAACAIDWDSLAVTRDPKLVVEEAVRSRFSGRGIGMGYDASQARNWYGGGMGLFDDEPDAFSARAGAGGSNHGSDPFKHSGGVGGGGYPTSAFRGPDAKSVQEPKVKKKTKAFGRDVTRIKLDSFESLRGTTAQDLALWLEMEPDQGAKTIMSLILEIGQLKSSVELMRGMLGIEEDDNLKGLM